MSQYALPSLVQGDSGTTVSLLQRLLILYGYTSIVGKVDGSFGKKTFDAVVQFQRDQNLAIKDGTVKDVTWHQLTFPAGTKP
jgi:peptidoglycan hydrolase-like protein with peptidoglycan-binding domain